MQETEDPKKFNVEKAVADAVAAFREEHRVKSHSQRHPELGKMINCPVCDRRHRSVIKCEQKILIPAANTRKGVLGAKTFAKKRIRPHHSSKLLQLVQLTQDLFPKYYPRLSDPQKAMQAARGEAQHVLSRKARALRRVVQQQQHRSRQINAGLVNGGIR